MDTALIAVFGVLVGAIVSSVVAPFAAQRAARLETFRSWQTKLAEDFLKKLAEVRHALGELGLNPGDNALATRTSGLIEDLNLLALRVELVFQKDYSTGWFRQDRAGAPDAAKKVIDDAKAAKKVIDDAKGALADLKLDQLDAARNTFVARASDEIRGRWKASSSDEIRGR